MSIETVHIVTVRCDGNECENSQVCGESEKYAEQLDWKLAVPVGDKLFDLCPECVLKLDDLVSFLLDPTPSLDALIDEGL